jgi:hypothetical protein
VVGWTLNVNVWVMAIVALLFGAFHPWIRLLFPWNWRRTPK